MIFFRNKRLLAEIEALKDENARLFDLGLRQAKEIKIEITNFIREILQSEVDVFEHREHAFPLQVYSSFSLLVREYLKFRVDEFNRVWHRSSFVD
jgi:hypothetical protein